MNFTLTNEQIKEFINRCVASRNKEDKKHYKYEIVNGEYPSVWVELTCDEIDYSQSYNIFLGNRVPYSPICSDMQEIYLEYMYELFGEEYLAFLEKTVRQKTHEAKEAAYKKYVRSANESDSALIDLLLFLNKIRSNSFQQ